MYFVDFKNVLISRTNYVLHLIESNLLVYCFVYLAKMESELKKAMKTERLERIGDRGGGCISRAQAYHTDSMTIFVKTNEKSEVGLRLCD